MAKLGLKLRSPDSTVSCCYRFVNVSGFLTLIWQWVRLGEILFQWNLKPHCSSFCVLLKNFCPNCMQKSGRRRKAWMMGTNTELIPNARNFLWPLWMLYHHLLNSVFSNNNNIYQLTWLERKLIFKNNFIESVSIFKSIINLVMVKFTDHNSGRPLLPLYISNFLYVVSKICILSFITWFIFCNWPYITQDLT